MPQAWREAVAGAVIIVAANGFLYPLAARMDRLHFEAGREVPPADYILEVECEPDAAPAVRALIIDALSGPAVRLTSLGRRNAETAHHLVLSAEVSAVKQDGTRLENAIRALSAEPTVRLIWGAFCQVAG